MQNLPADKPSLLGIIGIVVVAAGPHAAAAGGRCIASRETLEIGRGG
jgi:hypothetical protein